MIIESCPPNIIYYPITDNMSPLPTPIRWVRGLNKRIIVALAIVVLIIIAALIGILNRREEQGETQIQIIVCNAGSLTIPLQKVASEFENQTGIRVLLEPSGSVDAVRKVTDLHKDCDVVAVADYRLLRMYMYPNYTSWYVAFASNSIVIVYNKEKYNNPNNMSLSDIVNILEESRYGFSDPNRDPCGYRSVGVIGLISLYMNNLSILNNLIISKIPGSKYKMINNTLEIYIPPSFTPSGNLIVRPKSIDLISLLRTGDLDYAFEYLSVAKQHNLGIIRLPPRVNLGDPREEKFYSRVIVHILTGTKDEKAIPMAPIIYGVTVPRNAEHAAAALEFVKFLLSNGRGVFEDAGQPFLKTPIGYGSVPGSLKGLVEIENP